MLVKLAMSGGVLALMLGSSRAAGQSQAVTHDGHALAVIEDDSLLQVIGEVTDSNARAVTVDTVRSLYGVLRWSPEGDKLAYYSMASGTMQLWLYDVARHARRQLTTIPDGIDPDVALRGLGYAFDALRFDWSPNGQTIVFAHGGRAWRNRVRGSSSSRDTLPGARGDGVSSWAPLVLTSGTPAQLTLAGVFRYGSYGADARITAGGWTIVNSDSVPPRQATQLYLVDIDTRAVLPLTAGPAGAVMPHWSPDGRQMVYTSPEGRSTVNYGPDTSNVYVLDLASKRTRCLTCGTAGEKTLPKWSPDGRWIAYNSRVGFQPPQLAVVPADGSRPPRVFASIDRLIDGFAWAAGNSSVLLSFRDGVASRLARMNVLTGAQEQLLPPLADLSAWTTDDRGTMAWTQADDANSATWLWSWVAGQSRPHRVRQMHPPPDTLQLGRQAVITWRSSRGDSLEGIVVYPVHFVRGRRYPLVVDAYGTYGNHRTYDDDFGDDLTSISHEYVVFRPNHRAPHMWLYVMRGTSFAAAATGPDGLHVMADDILSGVDALVRHGVVDPGRMCVFGFSNGGLQALQLLTQTSRFRCAVLHSPATADWSTMFFLMGDPSVASLWMRGQTPWQDPAQYVREVPLYQLDKVTTPVLLAVGDHETALLVSTIEVFNGLRYLGRDVTLLRYPGQDHVLAGPAATDFRHRAAEFLQTHLNGPTP